MFKNYDKEIEKVLSSKENIDDWGKLLEKHRRMVAFIQHERLIHLLVMLFTGLVMTLAILLGVSSNNIYLIIIGIPVMLLFIGYIFHYRFLENMTQKWYIVEMKFEKLHGK